MSDLLGADIKAVVMTSELNATHQIMIRELEKLGVPL